jgi:hypothetical protein
MVALQLMDHHPPMGGVPDGKNFMEIWANGLYEKLTTTATPRPIGGRLARSMPCNHYAN